MSPELETLARRIEVYTTAGKRYKLREGNEQETLRKLSPSELQDFAKAAKCHVVSRLGGTILDFTRAGALNDKIPAYRDVG